MQAQANAMLPGSGNSTVQRCARPAHYASSTSPRSNQSPLRAVPAVRASGFDGTGAHRGATTAPPSTTAQAQQVPTTSQAPSSVSPRKQKGMPMATSQQTQQLLHSYVKGPLVEALGSAASSTSIVGEFRESRSQAQGSADTDVLASRVGEALTRLTVRVDEALMELRAELPKARQQIERQEIEIEALKKDQERDRVEYMARIEQLEKRVADDSVLRERLAGTVLETRDELSDRINADGASLEALAKRLNEEIACRVDLAKNFVDEVTVREELHKAQTQSLDLLEKNLAEEIEARLESETALGKELREHVALEVGGVREIAIREMKERMDGPKGLREEPQLGRVRLQKIEVRHDSSGLNQQQTLQKVDSGKIGKAHKNTICTL